MPSIGFRRALRAPTAALLMAWLPTAAIAAEGWAEIGWGWRWGSGEIVYNRDVEPTNPANGGATFRDSVGPFSVIAWEMFEQHRFEGWGGTLVTSSTTCLPEIDCSPSVRLVVELGPLSSGDPARWQVTLTGPGELDARGLPYLQNDESGPAHYEGYLSNDLNDTRYTAAIGWGDGWNRPVAAPVPEPASFGLMALGIGLLGGLRSGARRR